MDKKKNSNVFVYKITNKARFTENKQDLKGLRFHHIEKIGTSGTVRILDYESSLFALHNKQNVRLSNELCKRTTYNLMYDDYYDNMNSARIDLNGSYDDVNLDNIDLYPDLENYVESENRYQNLIDGWRA